MSTELSNTRTFDNGTLDDVSRRVFFKAMTKADAMLDATETFSSEKLMALAQIADASACGFKDEDDKDETY